MIASLAGGFEIELTYSRAERGSSAAYEVAVVIEGDYDKFEENYGQPFETWIEKDSNIRQLAEDTAED